MIATDQGKRPLVSREPASVTITVDRNENPPVFGNEPYTKEINRNAEVNTRIVTVFAQDRDQKVICGTFFVVKMSFLFDIVA